MVTSRNHEPSRGTAHENSDHQKCADAVRHLGVGIDTARFGHHVTFLREDKQPAAKPLSITESRSGYQQLQAQLEQLHRRYPEAHIHLRIDAAGQYAANLETFLRSLKHLPMTISVGEPKRNKDYHHAHSPKRQSDATESYAMARYAVVERPDESFGKPASFAALRRVAARVQAQTKQSTRLTNQLHETLSASFPELATLVSDISTGWVLELLAQYPTAERIAAARLRSLEKIPFLKAEKAKQLHEAAKQSVGTFRGEIAEELIRVLVGELRHSLTEEARWRKLLEKAFEALPDGTHQQIVSISGIGKQTAAAIVATAVSIERFETDNHLVGYYGVFPQELQSGVDKFGRPIPPGKKIMCRKGNDLVRGLLWQCAKCASAENGGNPAVRALYLRRLAAGDTPQIAWGYCMTKLLRQVFAVWSSGQPFNPKHETKRQEIKTEASGLKDESSDGKEVTKAPACLEPVSATDCRAPGVPGQVRRDPIDYAALREQVSFERVLNHLGQRVNGSQHRGPCPLHEPHAKRGHSFSVNLKRNAFRCFDTGCRAQGNVLDFWSAYRQLPLYEAAVDLARTFQIHLPTQQGRQRSNTQQKQTQPAGITPPSS
jgi:transposase